MKPTHALTALLVLGLAACGSNGDAVGKQSASPDPAATSLTVFAAASLTESFTELGKEFEADHPGAKVTFSFAGSQALTAQITQGAPADVLATADTASMESVKSLVSTPQTFARNQLAIVTEPGNPKGISTLADLAKPDNKVVLAAAAVPVGKAGAKALSDAGVTVKPVSEEQDVKAVLSKVELGEADAGIVYVTDLKAAGTKVSGTTLPGITNTYPIATVSATSRTAASAAFVSFVLGPDGQAVLKERGFAAPQ
jgi:molybdate transport system substrate-binding protein